VRSEYGAYDVLLHPNTGCEVRDHAEERSIDWLGSSYPLSIDVFSCNALGCNQACPSTLPPPANCSGAY
jgi:aromatic ring-cleaving dioxygenase